MPPTYVYPSWSTHGVDGGWFETNQSGGVLQFAEAPDCVGVELIGVLIMVGLGIADLLVGVPRIPT